MNQFFLICEVSEHFVAPRIFSDGDKGKIGRYIELACGDISRAIRAK